MHEEILNIIRGLGGRASFRGIAARSELENEPVRDLLRELKADGLVTFQNNAYQLTDWGMSAVARLADYKPEATAPAEEPDNENDPVLAAIAQMCPRAAIPGLEADVRRLRALANQLVPHPAVASFLVELADKLAAGVAEAAAHPLDPAPVISAELATEPLCGEA